MRTIIARLAIPASLLAVALVGCAPAPIYKPTARPCPRRRWPASRSATARPT